MTQGWTPSGPDGSGQQWGQPGGQPPPQPQWGQPGGQPAPQPQWGQPGDQWGAGGAQPPAYPAYPAFAPKPGVIPLRPLRLGDIWEGAIATIRGNPSATFGLSFLITLIAAIPTVLLVAWLSNLSVVGGGVDADVYSSGSSGVVQLADYLLSAVSTAILTGLLSYVLSQAVLGRRCSIGQTWRESRLRLLPLIAMTLIVVGGVAAVIAVVVGLIVLLASAVSGAAAAIVGVPLAFVAIVALVFLWVRLSLAAPIVVLEKAGPIVALQRSWALSRQSFWRILGISLLTRLVVGLISGFAALPGALIAVGSGGSLALVITVLWTAVVGAALAPFMAYVTGLLYIGERIRKEALDVALMAAAAR